MCDCVCHVRVNHKLKLPMGQKNKSHTTVKLGFLTCVPPPGLPQQHFFSENAMSKKPLQANGQTWEAISC